MDSEDLISLLEECCEVKASSVFGGKGHLYDPKNVLIRNEELWMSGQLSAACANNVSPRHELEFLLNPKFSSHEYNHPSKLEIEMQGGFAAMKCNLMIQISSSDADLDGAWVVAGSCVLADSNALQSVDIIPVNDFAEEKNRIKRIKMQFYELTDTYARIAIYYLNILSPKD